MLCGEWDSIGACREERFIGEKNRDVSASIRVLCFFQLVPIQRDLSRRGLPVPDISLECHRTEIAQYRVSAIIFDRPETLHRDRGYWSGCSDAARAIWQCRGLLQCDIDFHVHIRNFRKSIIEACVRRCIIMDLRTPRFGVEPVRIKRKRLCLNMKKSSITSLLMKLRARGK